MLTPDELMHMVMNANETVHSRQRVWRRYLQHAPDTGVFLEFGVWKGRSINAMASRRPSRTFHGFDSFAGLPEKWKWHDKPGHFATDFDALRFESNVRIHRGLFAETLPEFLSNFTGTLAGVHVDCDLGSSTRTVLHHLTPLLLRDRPIVLFDEFYRYTGFEQHEFGAWLDWLNATACHAVAVCRNADHQQVLFKLA